MRAPTPTGAAELAVPNIDDLEIQIHHLSIRLQENMLQKINYKRLHLDNLKHSFVLKNPMIIYENKKQMLDMMVEKMIHLMQRQVEQKRNHLDHLRKHYILQNPHELYKPAKIRFTSLIDQLELINPLGVLKRGYTVNYHEDHLVRSIHDVKKNDVIRTVFHDGEVEAKIIKIKEQKNGKEKKV